MAENLFSPEGLQEILSKITDIDTQLAAKSGSEAQQKKAAVEGIIAENSADIDKVVAQFAKALEKVDPAVVLGVLERFPAQVQETHQESIDKVVAAELAKVDTGDINPDTLKATRKELVADFESLKRLLVRALPEGSEQRTGVEGLEVPRRRGGSGTGGTKKSGKNKEGYRYSMDGKPRPDSQNTISSVTYYATEKCPTDDGRERWTTAEFKEFLSSQGVKFGEDDSWEVKLPNGKVVSAVREAKEEEPAEAPAA